ncbi:MAG TPA: intradiol ring-cleavage dioxygenase [Steroidobacteraceae bacterium]|jgi:hydroxyquinol 1,2-dioxygenase|nr:intradiol ring-cleavage dioxygenase [Steroidobacteraceae bacterium]
MREFDQQSITQAVIERLSQSDDPRFKRVMTSLITHLHDFVREVQLTESEWIGAIQFLTEVGKTCTEKRQEFILLSDTLGVSVLVITINHPADGGSAESTVLGPFYWEGAPDLARGSNLAEGVKGEPTFYSGRVLSADGKPLANALLDIWSGNGDGYYDMQLAEESGMKARGRIRTDAEGRYWFRSIRPTFYPVPTDGPVGQMLRKMGRHPYRPGHIHMIVSADGYRPVTTHLFVAGSEYLDTDAVFGMKESLVAQFERHPAGPGPNGERMEAPYYTVNYDFRLRPANPA